MLFLTSSVRIAWAKMGQARAGDDEVKFMKHAPEWVRTSDSVIRGPARYIWTSSLLIYYAPATRHQQYTWEYK